MSRRQGDVGYEDVAAKTLGEPARVVLLISLFLLTFLCAAAYFVLAADLIQPIVTAFIDTSLAADSARYYVMLAFMCIVGPLSFFKKLNALRFTSFLSIITISVLGVVLFYKLITTKPTHFIIHPANATNRTSSFASMYGGHYSDYINSIAGHANNVMLVTNKNHSHHMHPIHSPIHIGNGTILKHIKVWPNSIDDFMYALPISTVAYLCHFNVLPTNKELIKPTKKRIKRMIHSTIGICLSLYMVIAFCGYLFALDLTCGDILNNYLNDDPAISIGRVGLVITLAMSFPLLVLPCRKVLSRLVYMLCCCYNNNANASAGPIDQSSSLLSKSDQHLLRNPIDDPRRSGLLSPIGTFITDSPANMSARYSNSLRHKGYNTINYRTNNSTVANEQNDDHNSPIGTFVTDDFQNIDNVVGADDMLHAEEEGGRDNSSSKDIPLSIHIFLTIFILLGSSQIALHVTSVVQIWSILGSSISMMIAYIIPCSMYIALRRQQKYAEKSNDATSIKKSGNNDKGDEMQLLDNINNSSTLCWAWMLLIFAIFTSIFSTWQAIVQIKRPNCPHSIKGK